MNFLQKYPYLIITLAFIGVSVISFYTQDRISYNDGKGWDGAAYYKIAEQIKNDTTITGEKPFVYRQLVPYAVAALPFDILDGFYYVNLLANFFNVLLLLYWFRMFSKNYTLPLLFTFFYIAHWLGFLRFIHFYPASCDSVAFLTILLLLIFTKKLFDTRHWKYVLYFTITTFIGVLNREFIIFFSLPLLFVHTKFETSNLWFLNFKKLFKGVPYLIIPFTAGIIAMYITQQNAVNTGKEYAVWFPVIYTLFNKSIPEFLVSGFNTFGLLLILPFLFFKISWQVFQKEPYTLILLVLAVILSWGGGDTERFFMWFLPIYLLLVMKICTQKSRIFKKPLVWLPIAISLCFTLRLFWNIPQANVVEVQDVDLPILTVFGSNSYLNLMAFYANQNVVFLTLVQYAFLSVVTFFSIRYYQLKELHGK